MINYQTMPYCQYSLNHCSDVIMSTMVSQMTSASIVYSTMCSGTDQRKHQSSASLAFVRGIHRCPVTSPHKGPVTRKMFPFDDVIMELISINIRGYWIPKSFAEHIGEIYITVIKVCLYTVLMSNSDAYYLVTNQMTTQGRNKMGAILQTIFSISFPKNKNKQTVLSLFMC